MAILTTVRNTAHEPSSVRAADKVLLGRVKDFIHSDSLMVQRPRDLGLLYNHCLSANELITCFEGRISLQMLELLRPRIRSE